MLDETPTEGEQLFDPVSGEVASNNANDPDSETKEPDEGEQEQNLDLEDDDSQENKKPKEQASGDGKSQLEAFQKKINSGEIKSADDLPKAQSWMADYLKFPKAESAKSKKYEAEDVDVEEFKSNILNDLRAESNFENLKNKIQDYATDEQLQEISKFYKKYPKTDIASKLQALKLASEFARVDFDGISERRLAMRVPSVGLGKKTSMSHEDMMDNPNQRAKVPQEKRIEILKARASL